MANNKTKTNEPISKLSMRLFGMPYQFTENTDPRLEAVSRTVGKKFTENILLEAPVCTLIPGKPKYLPSEKSSKKLGTSIALLEAAQGSFKTLTQLKDKNSLDDMRLYDFERSYTEYMKYVNMLCRACASFLDLDETINVGAQKYSFQKYDWKNYRWNNDVKGNTKNFTATTNSIGNALNSLLGKKTSSTSKDIGFDKTTVDEEETSIVDDVLTNYNYVQFYVDPDVGTSDSISNSTGESQLKGLFDTGSSTMKELSFMANSGGMNLEDFQKFADESGDALAAGINSIIGNGTNPISQAGGVLSRLFNLSGDIIRGHNLIIPDIYQSSSYSKSCYITVHLKTPYGNKFGYYMDILVPLMHLLALALPRQESANSYGSPFLVKGYIEGIWTCNMGIVTDISITKMTDTYSADGLANEIDVSLSITDLYSDLNMTPTDAPLRFINNSSLVEYLATNCGMSLTKPNLEAKYESIINSVISKFTDIPSNVRSTVQEKIMNTINSITSLYR